MSPVRVLDSWAILAMFQGAPEAMTVSHLMGLADQGEVELLLSTVNLAEVVYRLYRKRGATEAEKAIQALRSRSITIVAVDESLAYAAGRLKAVHPISIADCVAAALAIREDAPLLTGDHDFERLGDSLVVEYLR